MHPTIFELRAFGQVRLAPPAARAVVRHLASGCGSCRAELAPSLIPWLDDEPAAAARATAAARCGPLLAGEYLRAARRVVRAAARRRKDEAAAAADRDMQGVAERLRREGPAAIGRLPRRLLGRPAVAALLRQIRLREPDIPWMRLRMAEMAWDLVERERALGRRPALRVPAGIELANALRANGEMRTAGKWLDRMAAALAAGEGDAADRARLEEIRASLLMNLGGLAPAKAQVQRASAWSRRGADAAGLARCLAIGGGCWRSTDWDRGRDLSVAAWRLADPVREPQTVHSAVTCLFLRLADGGDWRHARRLVDSFYPQDGSVPPGMNTYFWHRCLAILLDHEGDHAGALHAFAMAVKECRTMRYSFGEVACLVRAAACLERRGDLVRAAMHLGEAADLVLAGDPPHEMYTMAMLLRSRRHFSSLRAALPLDRVILFCDHAELNDEVRLATFLG
jgi:hypothetical protein